MMDDNFEIWHQPMKSPAEIVASVQEEMKNAPETIELKIVLTGQGANRYHFISKILEIGFGETPEVIAEYILRAGIQREITRLGEAMGNINETGEE